MSTSNPITVTLGMYVSTFEFGEGPIVAMSREWCIILTNPKAAAGHREVAVTWDQVFVPLQPPAIPDSTITEHTATADPDAG